MKLHLNCAQSMIFQGQLRPRRMLKLLANIHCVSSDNHRPLADLSTVNISLNHCRSMKSTAKHTSHRQKSHLPANKTPTSELFPASPNLRQTPLNPERPPEERERGKVRKKLQIHKKKTHRRKLDMKTREHLTTELKNFL